MATQPDPWAAFPAASPAPQASPQPLIPRLPPAQTPVAAARDEVGLARDQTALEAARRELAAGPQAAAAEAERKAAAFLIRAIGANQSYENQGVGPRSVAGQMAYNASPTVGYDLSDGPRQASESAIDEFIAASLRQDSGAAIPDSELVRQREILFPRPGAEPEAIAQARGARFRAIAGLLNAAGRSATPAMRAAAEHYLQAFNRRNEAVADANSGAPDEPGAPVAPPAASPEAPQDPRGSHVLYPDEARPPETPGPRPDEITFQSAFEQAINSQRFRNAEEALAFARQLNPAIGAGISRAEVARAVAAVRGGQRIIVALPPDTPSTPPISDVRGDEGSGIEIPTMAMGIVRGPRVTGQDVDAAVRGTADVLSVGLADEIAAGGDTLFGRGGTYGENLWRQRGIDEYDRQNNPYARFSGQIAGGALIPTRVGSVALGEGRALLREGAGMEAARLGASRAGVRRLAGEGTAFGGAYGFGSSEGDIGSRLVAGGLGAATGGITAYGIGRGGSALARAFGPRRAVDGAVDPLVETQLNAARSADALDIRLPRSVAGSSRDQVAGARLEQTAIGGPAIRRGVADMNADALAARDRIAEDVGAAVEVPGMGEEAISGGGRYVSGSRAVRGQAYKRAEEAAAGTDFQATDTVQTIGRLLREENEVIGGTDATPVLQHYADALANPGGLTIAGARGMRTALRERLSGSGMSPTNADRITGQIMTAVSRDIESSLARSGRERAIPLYREADNLAREGAEIRRNVLTPLLGRNLEKTPEEVARAIQNAALGNGTRLQTFLRTIPREEAGTVRATLINQLGRSTSGRQDAAGEAFSLDTFLTNWDQIRNARGKIFDRETVSALNHLANVAEQARVAGGRRGFSNTGAVLSGMLTGSPLTAGMGGALASGDAKMLAAGAAVTAGIALRQYVKASLLASPQFARRLANTPNNPARAANYWSGPWVSQLARSNPVIANDLFGFQRALLQHMGSAPSPVARAAANQEEPSRSEPPQ